MEEEEEDKGEKKDGEICKERKKRQTESRKRKKEETLHFESILLSIHHRSRVRNRGGGKQKEGDIWRERKEKRQNRQGHQASKAPRKMKAKNKTKPHVERAVKRTVGPSGHDRSLSHFDEVTIDF